MKMLSGIDIDVWSSAVADSDIPCIVGQASHFHGVKIMHDKNVYQTGALKITSEN